MRNTICALLATAAAAAIPATAHAANAGTFTPKVNNGVADFGDGTHVLGAPSGEGRLTVDMSPSGGQMVVSTLLTGRLYWDSLDPGCALLRVKYLDRFDDNLTPPVEQEVCGGGGNANNAQNWDPVDIPFAHPALDEIEVHTMQRFSNGTTGTDKHTFMVIPLVRNNDVKINSGTADLGNGGHTAGAPNASASVDLERDPGRLQAWTDGTIYWDALWSEGCAKVVLDYLDANGVRLGGDDEVECGPGGNATLASNHHGFEEEFNHPALWQVRVRVGSVVGGNFVNVTSRTYPFR